MKPYDKRKDLNSLHNFLLPKNRFSVAKSFLLVCVQNWENFLLYYKLGVFIHGNFHFRLSFFLVALH